MASEFYVGATIQLLVSDVLHRVSGAVDDPDTEPLTLTATITGPTGSVIPSSAIRDGARIWLTFIPTEAGQHVVAYGGTAGDATYRGRVVLTVKAWP